MGKAAWRRAGSLLGQQQRRTGRARQENPEFSPPRCFACLTASRALPAGLQPLPAPGAPQPARSPGRSTEVLQEPSLPQSLSGRCPSTGVSPHYSPQTSGAAASPSPVSITLFHRNLFFSSGNLFPMKTFFPQKGLWVKTHPGLTAQPLPGCNHPAWPCKHPIPDPAETDSCTGNPARLFLVILQD